MTTKEEALAMIEAAFADVPRPSNAELLHLKCADDMDLEDLYPMASWKDMSDDDVIGAYSALSFLSAAGFRHFIPAYMSFALRNADSGAAAVDSTVWAFTPDVYSEKLQRFAISKFALLDDAQREAIVAFLEAMPHEDAAAALLYWRSG